VKLIIINFNKHFNLKKIFKIVSFKKSVIHFPTIFLKTKALELSIEGAFDHKSSEKSLRIFGKITFFSN